MKADGYSSTTAVIIDVIPIGDKYRDAAMMLGRPPGPGAVAENEQWLKMSSG